jgi:hypothetical protein
MPMSNKQRPSFLKRQKEMARKQKQLDKDAVRQARKEQRNAASGGATEPAAEITPDDLPSPTEA